MGEVKSVMVVTVDWGRDINPWYTKTIACAIDYFVIQDLNALFLATNASCSRAKNGKVHKWLSGVALPHNHLGSHLNTKRETTDKQSKIKKFFSYWGDSCGNMFRYDNRWLSTSGQNYFWIQCWQHPTKPQEFKAVYEQES